MFTDIISSIDIENNLKIRGGIERKHLETDAAGANNKIALKDIEPLETGIQFAIQMQGIFFGKVYRLDGSCRM